MNTEEMQYQFFDTGWFNPDERPKTALAMSHLIEGAPDEIFDEIDVIVFAPEPSCNGRLLPGLPPKKPLIYLAPHIEDKPQTEVDFIVAHEFAHAYLDHEQAVRNVDAIEEQADALVVKWGFVVPDRRNSAFRDSFKKVSSLPDRAPRSNGAERELERLAVQYGKDLETFKNDLLGPVGVKYGPDREALEGFRQRIKKQRAKKL